jgi:hypothetical protein
MYPLDAATEFSLQNIFHALQQINQHLEDMNQNMNQHLENTDNNIKIGLAHTANLRVISHNTRLQALL